MRKGHKKNFMFTNKSQSERGIMSTVLGILSDVSIGLAVFSSFRIGGRASASAPEAELISFQKATECLSYVRKQQADVAFLDIRMRLMDGMELARQIKVLQPNMNIIFTTGYSDYIYDAVTEIRCSGYVLKPVTTEQVARELENLRHPIEDKPKARVHMQCFGNFEIFVDGKVLPIEPEIGRAHV